MSGMHRCGLLLVGTAWFVTVQRIAAASELVASTTEANSGRQDAVPLAQAEVLSEDQDVRLGQAAVEIVDVQITVTEADVAVVSLTAEGVIAVPSTSTVGNALIADIPNAVLNLPDRNEVQATNPTEGIAFVSVSNLPDNTVRIAITGINAPPVADIRATAQGLALSLTPGQTTAESAGAESIQIVITAERTEADLQDVPISVTAITRGEIEDANITSLSDIAANTPNFSTFSGPGQNRAFLNYSIRGLGNVNFFSSDTVGFYVDDVPIDTSLNTAFLDLNLVDLERVEVLRGPQSTLYGRNTQAGAVNIITRAPSNEFELGSTASYGRFNDANIQASVSGPVLEDQLFFRVSGGYASRDGYLENTFLGTTVDDQSGWTARGQLRWIPLESWDISFNASVDSYRDGGPPFVPLGQTNPFQTERDFDGFNNLSANSQSLRAIYTDSNIRVTSITARRFAQTDQSGDVDLTTADFLRYQGQYSSSGWTQEVRLQSLDSSEPLQWIAGGYFESRNLSVIDGLLFGSDALAIIGFPAGSELANSNTQTTSFGVFGQLNYQPIENLTLTAGLRYETNTTRLDRLDRVFSIDGAESVTTFSAADIQQRSDAFLPRFVAQYRVNPDLIVYGSITRGFKPAGVNSVADSEVTLTFNEERSWNYEIGLRSAWLDNRLAINFTLFHNPVSDYQVIFSDGLSGLPREIANADVRVTGFELETRATPVPGLDLIAGFGLANARFTNFVDSVSGESFNGNRVPFAPEFTYNLAAQYRSPIGLLGRVELQGIGTTFFDESNTLLQAPYAIVNARLGYEFQNYGIYLFANNIFDNQYLTYITPPVAGSNLALYGTPATYGIQLRARF